MHTHENAKFGIMIEVAIHYYYHLFSCLKYFFMQYVSQLAAVAALCVQYEADFRPNMTIVVKALQPLLNSKPAGPEANA